MLQVAFVHLPVAQRNRHEGPGEKPGPDGQLAVEGDALARRGREAHQRIGVVARHGGAVLQSLAAAADVEQLPH